MENALRTPLSRQRVLDAALDYADTHGLEALSMRKLAQSLGVEAMSLYRYVAGKDDLVDGMVDAVFGQIDLPQPGADWKSQMRRRAQSARQVLGRHCWATALLDTRSNPGPLTMRYHDAVLGCLRGAGFTVVQAAHAFSVLDSYIYGFALQESGLPFRNEEELAELAEAIMGQFDAAQYPHMVEMITEHALKPGYDYGDEFAFGLELVLDGVERMLVG